MLLYLPERIYNNVFKDDKTYADMVSKATEEIFTNDFVKSMIEYENDNILIKNLQKYIIEKSPEEYQMELELSFNDDLEKYESQFKQMDTETKLYWLCEVNGGNQVDTKEFDERNKKFKFYYEQFVLPEPEKYSNRCLSQPPTESSADTLSRNSPFLLMISVPVGTSSFISTF